MLRASSQQREESVNFAAVTDGGVDSGIEHGEALAAFAEAIVGRDPEAIAKTRSALVDAAGAAAMVDAAGVASNFQRMVRIADATGIELDERLAAMSDGLRESLGIQEYARA